MKCSGEEMRWQIHHPDDWSESSQGKVGTRTTVGLVHSHPLGGPSERYPVSCSTVRERSTKEGAEDSREPKRVTRSTRVEATVISTVGSTAVRDVCMD